MPRNFKSWADHSDRWKREARRDGLSPARWNRWRHLSPAAQADSNPRKYAQGESVAKQRHEKLKSDAQNALLGAGSQIRPATAALLVDKMSSAEMRRTVKADPDEIFDLMRDKDLYRRRGRNPWMYGSFQ